MGAVSSNLLSSNVGFLVVGPEKSLVKSGMPGSFRVLETMRAVARSRIFLSTHLWTSFITFALPVHNVDAQAKVGWDGIAAAFISRHASGKLPSNDVRSTTTI
jgi:hypothetical protein